MNGEKKSHKPGRCSDADAFPNMPIDDWKPAEEESTEKCFRWKEEYDKSMMNIREVKVGGEELRSFARAEMNGLRSLRHELFYSSD